MVYLGPGDERFLGTSECFNRRSLW